MGDAIGAVKEINGEEYTVVYDPDRRTVYFHGIVRPSGTKGFKEIGELLQAILAEEISPITLDLRELKLLNSSGITMLSRFVIHARQYKNLQLILYGSQSIFWQERSLSNLQRLLPTIELYLD